MNSWYQGKIDSAYKRYLELMEGGKPKLALVALAEMNNYKKMLSTQSK